jgi:acyl transferase domain-containing protein
LPDFGANAFIELGPHPTLCCLATACLANNSTKAATWLSSFAARKSDALVIQDASPSCTCEA